MADAGKGTTKKGDKGKKKAPASQEQEVSSYFGLNLNKSSIGLYSLVFRVFRAGR